MTHVDARFLEAYGAKAELLVSATPVVIHGNVKYDGHMQVEKGSAITVDGSFEISANFMGYPSDGSTLLFSESTLQAVDFGLARYNNQAVASFVDSTVNVTRDLGVGQFGNDAQLSMTRSVMSVGRDMGIGDSGDNASVLLDGSMVVVGRDLGMSMMGQTSHLALLDSSLRVGRFFYIGPNATVDLTDSEVTVGQVARPPGIPTGVVINAGGFLLGQGQINAPLVIAEGGWVSLGSSTGELTLQEDMTWLPGATYLWEMNDARGIQGGSNGWDILSVEGTLTLAGDAQYPFRVVLSTLDEFGTPSPVVNFIHDQAYSWPILIASEDIVGYNSQHFDIDTTGYLNMFSGSFEIVKDGSILMLTYSPASELQGDFDGDGDVDGNDFLIWQRGELPNPMSAEDLAIWQIQFGMTSGLSSSTTVPEPSTFILCGLSAFLGITFIRYQMRRLVIR